MSDFLEHWANKSLENTRMVAEELRITQANESLRQAVEETIEVLGKWATDEEPYGWIAIDAIDLLRKALYAADHIPDVTKMINKTRQWVGLTDDEIKMLAADYSAHEFLRIGDMAQEIEAILKEKNNGHLHTDTSKA